MATLNHTDKIKARLGAGDTVAFMLQGARCIGQVEKINPKRALVSVPNRNGEWCVPYAQLEVLENRADYTELETAALTRANELLREHNLSDWRAQLDDADSRAGCCNYSAKVISISRQHLRQAAEAEWNDTILHEIAHALAGARHGHDAVWKKIALSIGCSGKVRADESNHANNAQWLAHCPNDCFTPLPRRRRMRRRCRTCGAGIVYRRVMRDLSGGVGGD